MIFAGLDSNSDAKNLESHLLHGSLLNDVHTLQSAQRSDQLTIKKLFKSQFQVWHALIKDAQYCTISTILYSPSL